MARDRFGRQRHTDGRRTLAMVILVAGAVLVAWVLGIALLGGSADTVAESPSGGAPTAETSTAEAPEATVPAPAARRNAPPVQAEPVSRSEGKSPTSARRPRRERHTSPPATTLWGPAPNPVTSRRPTRAG